MAMLCQPSSALGGPSRHMRLGSPCARPSVPSPGPSMVRVSITRCLTGERAGPSQVFGISFPGPLYGIQFISYCCDVICPSFRLVVSRASEARTPLGLPR